MDPKSYSGRLHQTNKTSPTRRREIPHGNRGGKSHTSGNYPDPVARASDDHPTQFASRLEPSPYLAQRVLSRSARFISRLTDVSTAIVSDDKL
ncbi:hypothetical protein RSAG8_13757, partial [Rhizoctonia solani AG-8 WAC10335]